MHVERGGDVLHYWSQNMHLVVFALLFQGRPGNHATEERAVQGGGCPSQLVFYTRLTQSMEHHAANPCHLLALVMSATSLDEYWRCTPPSRS